MTQNEKELLFKDLCARLPYGVICDMWDELESESKITERLKMGGLSAFYEHHGFGVRPYLRPMSSMTDEEKYIYRHMLGATLNSEGVSIMFVYVEDFPVVMDWLNAHHFDYRGLIDEGLALKAPEGMYKTE